MKKYIFLFLSIILFSFLNIKADGIESPVTFTLKSDFYSTVTKTYEDSTTVFTYTNNILSMDLTDAQLEKILSQKSSASRLTYYETLNIDVKAVEGTPFEVLDGKTTVYRANGGGAWVSSIVHNQSLQDEAEIKNLNNNFWPWGFKVNYRTTEDGTYTTTIPSNVDLTNKTLEEQLATLLNIDLESNPNGVIDAYNRLYRFNPLNNYTFLIRFDFMDGDNPTLVDDSTTEYLTSSLDNLGTYYVAIKYYRTEDTTTANIVDDENDETKDKKSNSIPLISIVLALGGGSFIGINWYRNRRIVVIK